MKSFSLSSYYLYQLSNILDTKTFWGYFCFFMRKLFIVAFSLLSSGLFAQATMIKKVNAVPGKLVIPYEHYVLPNGLELIVSEDHSDPVAHINVTYHVGSARETPGKSGFAHFFEHMLFQGSKHVADEEHFKIIKEYGGEVNGNTTRDRTVYVETFPSNFTETALWMEADRMGFFLEGFTKEKFENQRSTVKNEKDERYDQPFGFLMEVKDQELYPSDHPYSWSTIGFVDDLDRADSNDLKNFFLRWYGPNNACIIVSGDVNAAEVVKWTEKYFGGIPAGKIVKKKRVKPIAIEKERVKSVQDANAPVPLMYITYPTVPAYHEDEAALDLLAYLMGGTKSSVIYKRFLDAEKALQLNVSNNPLSVINHELAGEFSFTMVGYPWSDMFKMKEELMKVVDSFEFNNFSNEDLSRAKQNLLSSFSGGFESVERKANFLSTVWYLDIKNDSGALYSLADEANRYQKITREDILRVYKKYLKGKFNSVIDIQPLTVAEGEKAPKYESVNPNANYKSVALDLEYQNLQLREVKDNFDRSIRPTPSAIKPVTVPKINRSELSNGVKVYTSNFDETSRVYVTFGVEGGELLENGKDIPWGVASLTAAILGEGTKNKTPEQLENALEKLGASIGFSNSSTGFSLYLECEKSNLDQAVKLMEEMMYEPRWDEAEFKKIRKRAVEGAKSNLSSRSSGMSNAWARLNYGESPFGHYTSADELSKVNIADCKKYYESYFNSNNSRLVVVGPITSEEVSQKLNFFSKLPKANIQVVPPVMPQEFATSQVFGVQYTDAEQSDIMMGFKSLPYDYKGDFFKNGIMNFALAGNFNSRMNLKIREEKGWTYGIRGGFSPSFKNMPGYYVISAGVKAETTDSAINEIIWMVNKYKEEGMSNEEFEFTKSALIASQALDYETLGQKAGFIAQMASRNLPDNYADEQLAVLESLSKDELNALAKKYLDTDKMVIVVAGDMVLLKDRLDQLGIGKTQLLNKDGSGKIKYYKAGSSKHIKNYR
jgi:zinc protease